jgi:hypothetical protein
LRDLPLLFFAIQVSGIYASKPGELNYYYYVVNLMTLAAEEGRRLIYPVMLIPPLRFGHRLTSKVISGKEKLVVVIGPFDGIVCDLGGGLSEVRKLIDEYEVPMIGYTGVEVLKRSFIEDKSAGFGVFAQRLEVEVNGRRF